MNAAKISWPLFIRRVAIGSKKNGEEFHGFHQNHPPIIGSNRLQTHQKTRSRRMVCPSKKSHPPCSIQKPDTASTYSKQKKMEKQHDFPRNGAKIVIILSASFWGFMGQRSQQHVEKGVSHSQLKSSHFGHQLSVLIGPTLT